MQNILEPLSRATQTLLKPIELSASDYLQIDWDAEADKFITQATAYRVAEPHESDFVQVNGDRLVHMRNAGSYYAMWYWQKRIPERRELGAGKYAFATTDYTVLVIHHIWKDKIVFLSEEAEITYKYLLNRFFSQTKSAELAAKFKVENEVPKMPDDFIEHRELPLSDYQKVALLTCLNQESSGLFMEQGTGKTPIVVNRVSYESRRKKGLYRCLVMCPKHTRQNWAREFERFCTAPGKVGVVRGGIIARQKIIINAVKNEDDCEWSATIISTDSVRVTWDALSRVPWDLIVLDESHYIKNPNSKRFKAIKLFNDTKSKAKMILTGTPIANTVFDLWSQLEFLGKGLSGFASFKNFRGFHGRFKNVAPKGATPIQKLIGIKALPLIQERLTRLTFMIKKSEANLNLPDKVYDIDEVEMTALQLEYYKKIATQLMIECEDFEKKNMTVDHVLTRLLRLAQITSGHVKWDDNVDPITGEKKTGKVEQIDETNPKIDRIIEMLLETNDPNSKAVVWCTFIEDIRALSEALHRAGIKHTGYHSQIHPNYRVKDPHEAAEAINKDRECKVFIGNPKSAKEGLNILGYDSEENPCYVDHEIYMSCNWSMIERAQSEDRVHRRGTRNNVRITDLIVPGTIDEEIRARVNAKKEKALMIQDVKEILRKLI